MNKRVALVLVIAISLLHIIPFFILVNMSFKSPHDTSSKWQTPLYLYLDNFTNAWQSAHLDQALLNSAIITVAAVTLVVIVGALASYPLARFPTRWNRVVYTLCISCMIVPALTILVCLYKLLVDIHCVGTYWSIAPVQ